ncbi:MAG: efflux RND transporter permease subunit, partial [Bacteroidales bacterium]
MIKFLLKRPIAVIMAFLAFTIIGLITYFTIPVSLLPDIAIPEITVQISGNQTSARELENTLVRPIRNQLLQVGRLRDISSETRDGSAIVRLKFDFGTDTDLAFIEVNEKIDASMSRLPRDVERPRVVKASATDIPVFCLNISLKNDSAYTQTNEGSFLELSEFAESVIKRRIEQLPEVAMVDISGITKQEIRIIPDERNMAMSGLSLSDLESALVGNNIEPGSMSVQDGYYVYNIKVISLLRTKEDVENILIRKDNRIFRMKDIAQIDIRAKDMRGVSVAEGKQAVTLAIIKQSDESMTKMKDALNKVTASFETEYPEMEFTITRNQTELLDYTISNLKQNLIIGFIFICIVAILFLGDVKSPFVIALSMIVSLIISFLFFYLCNVSLNIVSLSGLILALGMMIDSSIIVTENITQYKDQGYSLDEACDLGTTEVITPMLSSALTTIAVFIPLVFLSGIAGVIFF